MSTLFLFASQLDDESCLCLQLDSQGSVDLPLAVRPIDEIRSLQGHTQTLIVLATDITTLHSVNLPKLNDQKTRAAIPYILEDQIAQSVDSIHVAFDSAHYHDGQYLVVSIDKLYLQTLIEKLDHLELRFDNITIDWFALNQQEACVTENALLVNDDLFKGALSPDLATIYLSSPEHTSNVITFSDSAKNILTLLPTNRDTGISYVWIAQRLLHAKSINLCQGSLRHESHKYSLKQWSMGCAAMAGICVLSILFFNACHLYVLSKKTNAIDQKIAVIYKSFFPGSQQIISPRFRVEQLLKSNGSIEGASALWTLLDKFGIAFTQDPLTIEHCLFQGKVLSVTLVAKDFSALEQLESRLQKESIKVKQSQAATRDQQVVATLELSL